MIQIGTNKAVCPDGVVSASASNRRYHYGLCRALGLHADIVALCFRVLCCCDGETMQSTLTTSGGPAVQIPVMVAAELQDSLLVVMHDLHRLEGLLSHATDNLLERFGEANSVLTDDAVAGSPDLVAVRAALRSAVTELQFQDMASQLIWHTTKVLQGCAFRLASEAMGQDEGEEAAPFAEMAPDRPNPVTQSEMDAGSVDLF